MKTLIIPKRWINGYKMLCEFVKREGHARVKYDFVTSDGFKLGSWVRRQRTSYVNGRLTAEQIEALEALPGWNWNTIAYRWDAKYECLRAYAAQEGHSRPPMSCVMPDGFNLGRKVQNIRQHYKKNLLPAEFVRRLETLPRWTWDCPRSELTFLARFRNMDFHVLHRG